MDNLRVSNLIVCRHIAMDDAGVASLFNVLNYFLCNQFPAEIPQLCVWVGFEQSPDSDGTVSVTLTRDSDDIRICMQETFKADFRFARGTFSVEARFHNVPISEPGKYRVRVFDRDGKQLISRRITIGHFDEYARSVDRLPPHPASIAH
jgi:hypothetical protein